MIIFLLLLTTIVLSGVAIYQEYEKKVAIAGLEDSLKLKAPEENIVQYTEYDASGRPLANLSDGSSTTTNNNAIRYIYRTNKVVPQETYQGLKEDIAQRTPNAQIFLKSEKQVSADKIEKTYVGRFYSGVNFSKAGDKWYQTEVATTTKTAFLKQTRPTLLARAKKIVGQPVFADTYYSGAGDGYVEDWLDYHDGSESAIWTSIHDAVSGSFLDYLATTTIASSKNNDLGGGKYEEYIDRAFLPFDTSAIPVNASIISAILNIYVTSVYDRDDDGNDYINVVQAFQSSNASLVNADYQDCGSDNGTAARAKYTPIQEGATAIDLTTGFTTSSYNGFTLNATGLVWVAKSGDASVCETNAGVTCLGLREGHDLVNSLIANIDDGNTIIFSTSEETGTSQDPYLTVAYVVPVPAVKLNGGTLKINGGTVKVNSN